MILSDRRVIVDGIVVCELRGGVKLRGLFRRDLAVYDELLDPVRDGRLAANIVCDAERPRNIGLYRILAGGRRLASCAADDNSRDDDGGERRQHDSANGPCRVPWFPYGHHFGFSFLLFFLCVSDRSLADRDDAYGFRRPVGLSRLDGFALQRAHDLSVLALQHRLFVGGVPLPRDDALRRAAGEDDCEGAGGQDYREALHAAPPFRLAS